MGIKRNEIILMMLEDEEKAFKILLREKLTNDKKPLCDEIFINQRIAEYYQKKNNGLKYYYMEELEKIFKDEEIKELFRFDYAMYLNLYIDIYEKDLDEKTYCKMIKKICSIFKDLNNLYYYNEIMRKLI